MADAEKTPDDNGNDDPSNDTSNDDKSASGAAGTSNDTSKDDTTTGDVVTRAEFDAMVARMKGADQAKATAETKLREIERKDATELENANRDLTDFREKVSTLQKQVDDMALENDFLTNNKYTWHDPSDAMRLMDMQGVEVKDGKVIGLGPAIEKLAKAKPHLLKADASKKDDKAEGTGPSGSANNGRRKGEKNDPPKDYSLRFPALRR